jgi:8-oxo-dGTP pyrophosphatase MutT (NUDIX family)
MTLVEQAGAVPFTVVAGTPRILLIRARQDPSAWIFPKGHVERGETAAVTAVRELLEEAGVEGTAIAEIGVNRFRSANEEVSVRYFLVRYEGEPRGGEQREWQVLPLDDAIAALTHPDARALLERCRDVMEARARGD